ncbi:Hypothetical protein A7982_02995 [Minicystis rosea]|nr:Hypothetical protein A7982_02995 [Minicystis rosea]
MSPLVRAAQAPQATAPVTAYPWLDDPAAGLPPPADALVDRFAAPSGFTRVALDADGFGAWLRRLPLAPPGTSVVSYRGDLILPADHANLAAVVDLDIGARDLQQCADSIIRLHAEWLYARGRRDMSYRAASGAPMPFARWAQGERTVPEGIAFRWAPRARPDTGRASFRGWLDAVFGWANTGSLARDTSTVALDDLRPGISWCSRARPGMRCWCSTSLARPMDGARSCSGKGSCRRRAFMSCGPAGTTGRGSWSSLETSRSRRRSGHLSHGRRFVASPARELPREP